MMLLILAMLSPTIALGVKLNAQEKETSQEMEKNKNLQVEATRAQESILTLAEEKEKFKKENKAFKEKLEKAQESILELMESNANLTKDLDTIKKLVEKQDRWFRRNPVRRNRHNDPI